MYRTQLFNHHTFGNLDVIVVDGKEMFGATQVAKALGYSNPHDAINRHCKKDGLVKREVADSLGRSQEMNFISEGNLYRLITHSKLPECERFENWVFEEVIPSIRKHGAYMTPEALEAALTNPDTMIQILTRLKEEQAARTAAEQKIQLDAPKVALYDTAMSAGNDFTMERVSKTIGYGRNKLFRFLREQKILRSNNLPYQEFINRGYFNVRQYSITHLTQGIENKTQTLVTPKGMAYIHKLLCKNGRPA